MRNPSHHLDDNAVVDLLAGALPLDDAAAAAVHLFTCGACAEMVEACRAALGEGPPGLGSRPRARLVPG